MPFSTPGIEDGFLKPLLKQATELHSQGRHHDAEILYRKILSQQPNNVQVGHLLGLLAIDAGLPQSAIPILERVRMLDPGNYAAHYDLGRAYMMTGQFREALASFDRTIVLKTDFAAAHTSRGFALTQLQRLEDALAGFQQALALEPDSFAAHTNCGAAFEKLKRFEEALSSFETARALAPENADLPYNFANLLRSLGRHDEAIKAYDRAIELRPDFAEAHFNRGLVLAIPAIFEAAMNELDSANLGLAASTLCRRGLILARIQRSEEALEAFDRSISLRPGFLDSYISRIVTLAQIDRADEAIAYCRQLIRNPLLREDVSFNLSLLLLQHGQWKEGWKLYEARKTFSQASGLKTCSGPLWLGKESLDGKRLYVHAEQGLGDTIQFCRYLSLAQALGAQVIFSAQDGLMRLLRSHNPDIAILPLQAEPAEFDFQMPLLSMPLAFGTITDTAPVSIPYLHAEAELVQKWKERIGRHGFKIGLCWRGNPGSGFALERSFPLHHVLGLAKIPGVRLIGLQNDLLPEELAGMMVETLGADFDAGPDAFIDTAAAMQSLDLVISCDTSTAHLAGALGLSVWMALNYNPEWRWQVDRSDCPWYPTMTLFRQTGPGDWKSVFTAMHDRLAKQLSQRRAG